MPRARPLLVGRAGLSIATRLSLLSLASALSLCACHGAPARAESPEEAYSQLLAAADSGDPARLFDALDTATQWAIETVHKSEREVRALVVERYPAGPREAALARIPAACEESLDRPRRYFRRLDGAAAELADIKRRLYLGTGQPVGSVRKAPGVAEVWREGGSIFHFQRDDGGRWGYGELRDVWERKKERALHDLATARENAALYSRVAGDGGAPRLD